MHATAGAVTHHLLMPVKRPLPMSCQKCQRTRSGHSWIRRPTSASAGLFQRVQLVMHLPQLSPQCPRALRRSLSSPCSTKAMTMDIACPHAEGAPQHVVLVPYSNGSCEGQHCCTVRANVIITASAVALEIPLAMHDARYQSHIIPLRSCRSLSEPRCFWHRVSMCRACTSPCVAAMSPIRTTAAFLQQRMHTTLAFDRQMPLSGKRLP